MAKFRKITNSLLAGEISPTAFGRTDINQYNSACKVLRNMIPLLSGGAYGRPGTFYEAAYPHATQAAPKLVPFVVSKTEAYVLAFGRNLTTGASVINYYRPTSNTAVASTGTVTGSHNFLPATLSTDPLGYDQTKDIDYAQSGDSMIIVRRGYKPKLLTRTTTDTFTIVDHDNGQTGVAYRDARPYLQENTSGTTMAISASTVGTGRTVTLSGGTFRFDAGHFSATNGGAVFKFFDGVTAVGCFRVTAVLTTLTATVEVMVDMGTTAARLTWWESAWSDYRGWPETVTFFQQRLCYGGNDNKRDSIWFSHSDSFFRMSDAYVIDYDTVGFPDTTTLVEDPRSTPVGDMAFTIEMASLQLNKIQWMASEKTLVVGTNGDEWIVQQEQPGGFSCDNSEAKVQTHYGSTKTKAVRAGSEILFNLGCENEIRSLVFNLLQNSYSAEPTQLLFDEYPRADNIGRRKHREFVWDETRKTLWCCDTKGNVYGLTRERTLQVNAWHSHQLGGYDASEVATAPTYTPLSSVITDPAYQGCSGSVNSVAAIPNPVSGLNDIWFVVLRKINGLFQYHLERMIGGIHPYDSAYVVGSHNYIGNYFLDSCAIQYNDYPAPEGFGATLAAAHLVGETLLGTFYGENGLFTASTVSSPTISNFPPTYDSSAFSLAVGLPFSSYVIPVRIEAGSQIGTAQGGIKRIHDLFVRFYRTLSAKIGPDLTNTETVIFRDGDTPLNKSAELFTGDKQIKPDSDYDRDAYIVVLNDKPLPFAVISIIAEGAEYDG